MLASITKFLIALAVLLIPTAARAQVNPFTTGSGAPSGACTSSQIYLDTTGHVLYTCNNGAWVSMGSLPNPTGGSVSLPTTLSAPGVFTNTQQNENFSIVIGSGCTPASIFPLTQAGNFGTDGVSGTVCVPSSGVTNGFSSGVHGYASNAGATTGCAFTVCSAVAVAGDAISIATGSPIWSGNFVAQTTSGHAAPIHAVEIDANPLNSGDTGEGLLISGLGTASPTGSNGTFPAVRITKSIAGATGEFSSGFYCDVGATNEQACLTAAPGLSGNSRSSQTVEWDGTGSGGATTAAAFQEVPVGASSGVLKLFGGGGAALQLPTYTVSTLPSSLPSGSMAIVTDASTFTVGTCTGGGSDMMVATFNGTAWSCH